MRLITMTKAITKGSKLIFEHKILRARWRLLNAEIDCFGLTPKRDVRHIKLVHELDWSRTKMRLHTAYTNLVIAKWKAEK